ncbi:Uncharacterized protein dnl_27130 [Desulfonema limicola]|uniref:Uncharacterized protein n=1 Tax=Desulfonema limicola TaxID=45656 RepID=A0A975B7Q3_9BACT|nr:hypothetical protein [Desulfonema limicola]QTA80410.1 Uncharacterized protein dnl_27130 [Desulfonema limicola]
MYESKVIREFRKDVEELVQKAILKIAEKLIFKSVVISVSHSNYLVSLGGTEKVLHEEQAELARHHISYLQIYSYWPYKENQEKEYLEQLIGVNIDSVSAGQFTIIQLALILRLLDLSGLISIKAIHIHHLMNMSVLGVKYLIDIIRPEKCRIYIHDYYSICPQFNLLKDDKEYCAGELCRECKGSEKRYLHYNTVKKFFNYVNADFIAPSRIAADIWCKFFNKNQDNIRIIPHQVIRKKACHDKFRLKNINDAKYRLRIAYVGYESFNKGLETWWNIVSDPELIQKYDFFHLGAAEAKKTGVTYIPVSFLENGPNAMVRALQENQIDIAFLWSIWPETYSFTLHEAFAAGCFVITNLLSGNIAEQVKKSSRGVIFENESAMISFLKNVSNVKSKIRQNMEDNFTFELEFNPQISLETAESLITDGYSHVDKKNIDDLYQKSGEWEDLLKVIEIKTLETEYIKSLQNKANNSEGVLFSDMFYNSRLYNMIEYFRQYAVQYPAAGYIGEKLFSLIWNIFKKIKKGKY